MYQTIQNQTKPNITIPYQTKSPGRTCEVEICPSNGSTHSSKWIFNKVAVIKLPIVCSLRSELINCHAIRIKSGATKESHLSHYRMKIIETKFEEEKININKTKFIRLDTDEKPIIQHEPTSLLENIRWPLIGTGASLAAIILITCIALVIKKQSSSELSVKIENNSNPSVQINNLAQQSGIINPSAPSYNPSFVEKGEQQKSHPTLTLQDGINAILAIKPEHRTPIHDKNLMLYRKELEIQQSCSSSDQRD